ncbi:uncharacterized protein LOC108199224 [Daucus carota subsp. sativus]|uniref:uncharacterized protein LOC108199224 n=1 Tax=Daucus carota subsp. sativus TaxID=79200 RepID=UPI003082D3E4
MASGGEKRIRKISELTDEELEVEIWGKTGTRPRIDRAAIDYRRNFPFAKDFLEEKGNPPDHVHVPPSRQMWRKDLYPQFLRAVKVQEETYEERYKFTGDFEKDDQEALVYRSIDDYIKLSEDEKIATREYQKDMRRYHRDEAKSRGFDVGSYPYRDYFGLTGIGYLYCYYKPPEVTIPKARLITLLHLSRWAVAVYNSYQGKRTCYGNVRVVKAMSFGCFGTDLNISFQAASSSGDYQFQATVLDCAFPPDVPYSSFKIVLVRKLMSGEEIDPPEEIDYVGVRFLPVFPFSMEKLSDFDEKEPQSANVLHFYCEPKVPYPDWLSLISVDLPLNLCEFVLHQYNIALHRFDSDKDEDDEIYDKVKVLRVIDVLRTLDAENGTTYYVTFEASLLDDEGNPQVFETKLFMSPLIPTTKIRIKFVRVKSN